MAINYALNELLHWENENAPLNALAIEFRFSRLSDDLLQNAAKNHSDVYVEISDLLNKIVLISIYNGNRRFKSEELSKESLNLSEICNENEFESTLNTINVIVPIYLENLKYPRMVQLFSRKSSREVLLAIAFLISKNKLFEIVDRKCYEIVNLTKRIAYNVSMIADSTNSISLDDIYKEFGDGDKFKSFLNSVFEKVDYNNFSISESFNESSENPKKSIKGGRLRGRVVQTDSVKRFNQSMMESLSHWIECALGFNKELTERAIMLATPKGCKDYDTERLRVGFEMIDSRFDTKTDGILTRSNTSIEDKNESDDVKDGCKSIDSLTISSLSDQIIQLQNKLRSLSGSIYRKDRERSAMFAKAATQFKAHKSGLNKLERESVKPSPLEYVLISDDNSFETNMALLAVISRSLVSEFTRFKFWNLVKKALVDANKSFATSNATKSGISVGIYKKPSDIKLDIEQLKSFLTKGISPANFTRSYQLNSTDSESVESKNKVILEFLRTVNSQFTNIAAQNTSKTLLHRTLFHTFILEQLGYNDNKTSKTTENNTVKKRNYSNKFKRAVKSNPTIDLGIFNEWVIEGHLDDIQSVSDLTRIEEDNERIYNSQSWTLEDEKEAKEMDMLDNDELNYSSKIVNRISSKLQAYTLAKNITAPDPSRASKGMGEFVSSIKSIDKSIIAKLKIEQEKSEMRLNELKEELKRVTNCVIMGK